jgi:hypothetical protein
MTLREMAPGVAWQKAFSGTPDQVASVVPAQSASLYEETVGTVDWANARLAAARRTVMNCMIFWDEKV